MASGGRAPFAIAVMLGLAGAAALLWPRRDALRSRPSSPATASAGVSAAPPPVEPDAAAPAPVVIPTPSWDAAAPPHVEISADGARLCPPQTLFVAGLYCPFVAHRCEVRASDEAARARPIHRRRCQRYAPELICEGRPLRLRFCIDRFEYPNLPGALPAVMVTHDEARAACASEGKRLCDTEEWTLACEGPARWPHPYGLERDPSACNIDRRDLEPDLRALSIPVQISVEVERIDERIIAGGMPGCVSPFGVHDLTGNVAEWVRERTGLQREVPSERALQGGHWGPVSASCRTLRPAYDKHHRSHRAGFRCCADPSDGERARVLMPDHFRLPKRQRMTP